jgi:hypothetical protein
MNTEELILKNKLLEEELQKTKDELYTTKEHLKKYTSPTRHKTYYENHKEEILEKMKKKPPTDKEKRKEINQKAYLKRKEKSKESQNI